jgi:uncharacterized protein
MRRGMTIAAVLRDGINHVLKTRKANVATDADPALPLAPGVVPAIAEFVRDAAGE